MLRFTACLLSAALPGSFLSFEIIYSHCQINSLRFSFQCPFLRHLRFWKLIYPVWHAVYDKSASKFDSYHNHLPCYYGMDYGCTELLQLFHNPCPVCVRTVLSLFLLLLYISKQPFQITGSPFGSLSSSYRLELLLLLCLLHFSAYGVYPAR